MITVSIEWYGDFLNEGSLIVQSRHDSYQIGYARCSTDKQNPAAQKLALEKLGIPAERIYTDHGPYRD